MQPFILNIVTGKSGRQSGIAKLDGLYPECSSLTWDAGIPNLSCWISPYSCDRGSFSACMSTLVQRAFKLFTGFPKLDVIILHWEADYKDAPYGRRRWGLIIDRDENSEMRLSPLNRWALHKLEHDIGSKFSVDFS